MIDKVTGEIILADGRRLGPPTRREEFEASTLGQMSAISVRNEPWCSYRLPLLRFDGEVFGAIIYFYGSRMDSLTLTRADLSAQSWADWSEEKEVQADNFHQAWLTKLLGSPRKFSWGEVWAGRDAKTTDSKIIIRWQRRSKGRLLTEQWSKELRRILEIVKSRLLF